MFKQPIRAVIVTAALLIFFASVTLAQTSTVFLPVVSNSPRPTSTPIPTNAPTPTSDDIPTPAPTVGTPNPGINAAIVFVSRQIPPNGSIYWPPAKSMPGVGIWGRFQVAAPGKLMVREADGSLRVLIDGANPTDVSLNLIDVDGPDVSYDGSKILFSGLPKGVYSTKPMENPNAWRLYQINVDGSGLQQLTFSDLHLDYSQFAQGHILDRYDDFDPIWLPDGRIMFSSTRWPSYAMYSAAHTSNLYVMNADGSSMRRVTAERNAAERAQVDPLTGRIVYSRWWRNFRLATNSMETVADPSGGFEMKDGLVAANYAKENNSVGSQSNLRRNAWMLATINPDGTNLHQFAGDSGIFLLGEDGNHAYGGVFAPDGTFYANFFPMKNMSEAAGFGGIRSYVRGANGYTSIIGVTSEVGYQLVDPAAFGVNVHDYAAEPAVLPDGRLLISWASDINQDYGLFVINADGSNRQLLYDVPGMTELRARVIAPRPLPPIIPDQVTAPASLLPPLASPPYDIDGKFTFRALNVYFNGPVDSNIISAIPVGSAGTIRFFLDHQRNQQIGSDEAVDWPILLTELPVNPDGSVTNGDMPANLPLFEQIRTKQADGYVVPLTGRTEVRYGGAAHVAGLNYGRPGEVVTCVGCHAGHSMLPIPANPADAQFTNLATGATVSFSSVNPNPALDQTGKGLIDRKVQNGVINDYWRSDPDQDPNLQWVQFTFPVPVTVRNVRLYNPRPGTQLNESTIQVNAATVRLYADVDATQEVANQSTGALAVSGSDVTFADVKARTVRVYTTNVSGVMGWKAVSSLAEVEIIARGEAN